MLTSTSVSKSQLGIEIGICGIVFGFVYDFGQETLSAAALVL